MIHWRISLPVMPSLALIQTSFTVPFQQKQLCFTSTEGICPQPKYTSHNNPRKIPRHHCRGLRILSTITINDMITANRMYGIHNGASTIPQFQLITLSSFNEIKTTARIKQHPILADPVTFSSPFVLSKQNPQVICHTG